MIMGAPERFEVLVPGVPSTSQDHKHQTQGDQKMRIGLVEVFVDDQDHARDFYTGMLGLEVKDDVPYTWDARWLTLVSPEDRDGTELVLTPRNDAAKSLQDTRRESGTPALSFTTDDCYRVYQELRDRGVVFRSEPQAMSYGGVDAVFEDGCGNLLNLHQDTSAGGRG
jgi:catechol 2,3-dioxygenase-like lactoylglutathione lyase family enzyme